MMETYTNIKEVSLRDYLRIIFRHKSVIMITFISLMLSTLIGLGFWTQKYQANVKMLILAEKQVESPYYKELMGYSGAGGMAIIQSEIVKSNAVIERVVRALGLYERPLDYEKQFCLPIELPLIDLKLKIPELINNIFNPELKNASPEQKQAFSFRMAVEDLKANIAVEPLRDTNLFTISVTDFSPVGSAIMANAISRSYLIYDLEQQLVEQQLKYGEKHPTVIQLKDNIEKINQTLGGQPLPNIEAIGPASVKIIEQASVPLQPVFSEILILALAFPIAGFLGIMLTFLFEFIDSTFKSPQDIEKFLNLPYLGSIPKIKLKRSYLTRDIKETKKTTGYIQSFNNLTEQIYLLIKNKNLRAILFTAALPQEGTSTIIANLAISLGQKLGHRVFVIDANLRNPSLYKIFKISDNPGLTDVLENKTTIEEATQNLDTNLTVLPAGRTLLNPITLLDSKRLSDLIEQAKQNYEIILVDSSQLKNFKDAVVLSSNLDGVILVIKEGKTRRQVVKSVIAPLEEKKDKLLGVILSQRTFAIPKIIYERF